jgi:hypothetical protein
MLEKTRPARPPLLYEERKSEERERMRKGKNEERKE